MLKKEGKSLTKYNLIMSTCASSLLMNFLRRCCHFSFYTDKQALVCMMRSDGMVYVLLRDTILIHIHTAPAMEQHFA